MDARRRLNKQESLNTPAAGRASGHGDRRANGPGNSVRSGQAYPDPGLVVVLPNLEDPELKRRAHGREVVGEMLDTWFVPQLDQVDRCAHELEIGERDTRPPGIVTADRAGHQHPLCNLADRSQAVHSLIVAEPAVPRLVLVIARAVGTGRQSACPASACASPQRRTARPRTRSRADGRDLPVGGGPGSQKTPPDLHDLRRRGSGCKSGAEGIRTPDPLTASQVRYQLRHSPLPE
jgi:hypothetical protein